MIKTINRICLALMGALATLASGCAADEEMGDKATGSNGKLITIMVGTGSGSNTRVSYDENQDGIPSLTWELNDKLSVLGYTRTGIFLGKKEYILNAEDHGKPIGAFTGEEIVGADLYTVCYPHTAVSESGIVNLILGNQTQVGDKSTVHLKNNIFFYGKATHDVNNVTLSMRNCILKFKLSGIPKDVGILKELRWVVETASGERTLMLAFSTATADRIQFSDTKNDLTAYLSFLPRDMDIKQGGKFRVELVGDKTYYAETTVDAGKTYEEGHWYTALIDGKASTMEWKP